MSSLSLKNMSAEAATKAGEELVAMLGLKPNKETKRYDTQWGNKTLEGLGRCMFRIVTESTITTSTEPKEPNT